MRVSEGFLAFVLDQLEEVPRLSSRRMFGGVGLYGGDLFFGILADDVLYLKVDADSRPDYAAAGMHPFRPYPDRAASKQYYAVPVAVLEDTETLMRWALRAIEAARRAKG